MYEQLNDNNQQQAFYGGSQEGHIGDQMNRHYNYQSQVRIFKNIPIAREKY